MDSQKQYYRNKNNQNEEQYQKRKYYQDKKDGQGNGDFQQQEFPKRQFYRNKNQNEEVDTEMLNNQNQQHYDNQDDFNKPYKFKNHQRAKYSNEIMGQQDFSENSQQGRQNDESDKKDYQRERKFQKNKDFKKNLDSNDEQIRIMDNQNHDQFSNKTHYHQKQTKYKQYEENDNFRRPNEYQEEQLNNYRNIKQDQISLQSGQKDERNFEYNKQQRHNKNRDRDFNNFQQKNLQQYDERNQNFDQQKQNFNYNKIQEDLNFPEKEQERLYENQQDNTQINRYKYENEYQNIRNEQKQFRNEQRIDHQQQKYNMKEQRNNVDEFKTKEELLSNKLEKYYKQERHQKQEYMSDNNNQITNKQEYNHNKRDQFNKQFENKKNNNYTDDRQNNKQQHQQQVLQQEQQINKVEVKQYTISQDFNLINDFCKTHFNFSLDIKDEQSWLYLNYYQLLSREQLNKTSCIMKKVIDLIASEISINIKLPKNKQQFSEYEKNFLCKIKFLIENIIETKRKLLLLNQSNIQQIKNGTYNDNARKTQSQKESSNLEFFENKFQSNEQKNNKELDNYLQTLEQEQQYNQKQNILQNFNYNSSSDEDNDGQDPVYIVQQQKQNNFDEDMFNDVQMNQLENTFAQISSTSNEEIRKINEIQKKQLSNAYSLIVSEFSQSLKMEILMFERNLPAYEIKQALLKQINTSKNPFLLLIGSTGSGKTTQTPQYILQEQMLSDSNYKKIFCVQPKKINCLTISERVSQELCCQLGDEVGYIVGYSKQEQKVNYAKTRIIFITQTMFLSLLIEKMKEKQKNENSKNQLPNFFSQISHIILDEIHERTVEADIIIGLMKQMFSIGSSIKIILSSATVNTQKYLQYFNQSGVSMDVIQIPGKMYEVEEVYTNLMGNSVKKVMRVLREIINKVQEGDPLHQGHILIFLTDVQEIEECINECKKLTCIDFRKFALLQLHQQSDSYESKKVFQDLVNPYTNKMIVKIIFATNIAESAITINNVTIVIDSGKEKNLVYNSLKNISNIKEQNISKSSAIQRQGRAGRTCAGVCYKLYTEIEYESFVNDSIPEIKRVNIDFPVLKLLECGVKDISQFPFFETPGNQVLQNSIQNLKNLGAISENGDVTQLGKIIQFTELEPFQVRCIIEGVKRGVEDQVLSILAVMSEYHTLFKKEEKDKKNQSFSNKKQNNFQDRRQRGQDRFGQNDNQQDNFQYDNEYKSDFLFYNFLYNKILDGLKKDQSYLAKNNIKNHEFTNILTLRNSLVSIINKARAFFPNEFKQNSSLLQDKEEERIQKSMFCNFINQISVFTGSKLIGFRNIYSDITFCIHPYSKYSKTQFEEGDLLFYGQLENKETINFAKHVSVFKKEWIQDANIVPEHMRNEINKVFENKLSPKYACEIQIGKYILEQIRKKYQEQIQMQFDKISQNNPQVKFYLVLDENASSIKVLCSSQGEKIFKEKNMIEFIMNYVKQERSLQKNNIFIHKYKETQNYAVFGQGYQILDILLPHEYVKVKISNIPNQINEKQISQQVIEEFFSLQNNPNYSQLNLQKTPKGIQAFINFKTYDSAKEFVYKFNLNMPKQLKDMFLQGLPESKIQQRQDIITVVAEWPIWKSKQAATIYFGQEADRNTTYNQLLYQTIDGFKIKTFKNDPELRQNEVEKVYCINLSNLSPQTSEVQLKRYVVNTNQGFQNIVIRREPQNWSEKEKLEKMQKYTTTIKEYVESICGVNEKDNLQINYDYGKKGYIKAKIQFQKQDLVDEFCQKYKDIQFGEGRLILEIQNQIKISIKHQAFQVIFPQYQDLIEKYSNYSVFETRKADYETLITVTTKQGQTKNQNEHYKLISQQLKNILKPHIMNFDVDPKEFWKSYDLNVNTFNQIQDELMVYILPTPKKAEISVWFSNTTDSIKQAAIKQINEVFGLFIQSERVLKKKHYNLENLKNILSKLQSEGKVWLVEDRPDIVVIKGTKTQLQEALKQVNSECKLVNNVECCKICYEDKSIERIDQCGCSYCQDCILQHVLSSGVQNSIISCPDHKDSLINFEDIKDIILQNDEEKLIQAKINQNIDIWVNKKVNKPKFIRCNSVNCDSFFIRVYFEQNNKQVDPEVPTNLKCPECCFDYCLLETTTGINKLHNFHSKGKCGDLHDGKQLLEQLKSQDAQQCPGCKQIIVRSSGCNHMTCRCGAHFCFKCLFYPQPSVASSVYAHMSQVGH